ncbi:MAG: hypothetical protein PT953_05000, partial [Prevotella sp.]|nr:hypothetical protein [Prevotella sp.]
MESLILRQIINYYLNTNVRHKKQKEPFHRSLKRFEMALLQIIQVLYQFLKTSPVASASTTIGRSRLISS